MKSLILFLILGLSPALAGAQNTNVVINSNGSALTQSGPLGGYSFVGGLFTAILSGPSHRVLMVDTSTLRFTHDSITQIDVRNLSTGYEIPIHLRVTDPMDPAFTLSSSKDFVLHTGEDAKIRLSYKSDGEIHNATLVISDVDSSATYLVNLVGVVGGVDENRLIVTGSIYPNPASGRFTAVMPNGFGHITRIDLLDDQGKTLRDIAKEVAIEGSNLYCTPLAISNGMYFLRVENKSQALLYKVIVKK